MAAITAGVCVFLSLLAVFPFLLWLPAGEGEKGERVSTSPLRWAVCLGLPPLMAWYGVRRKSLDISGGVAGILVGFVLTVGSGCFCVSSLVFFLTSSRLTRWRGREKEKWEEEHKEGTYECVLYILCNFYPVLYFVKKIWLACETNSKPELTPQICKVFPLFQEGRETGYRWCAMEVWPVLQPCSTCSQLVWESCHCD